MTYTTMYSQDVFREFHNGLMEVMDEGVRDLTTCGVVRLYN